MNVAIAGGLVGLFSFLALFYGMAVGFSGNLADAKVGDVYNFKYLQPSDGREERYLVRVIDTHYLSEDAIARLNARSSYRKDDPTFVRTGHLITGQSADGTIRNFYAERTKNCRKKPLAKLLYS